MGHGRCKEAVVLEIHCPSIEDHHLYEALLMIKLEFHRFSPSSGVLVASGQCLILRTCVIPRPNNIILQKFSWW